MDALDPVGLVTLRTAVREGTFERTAKALSITPSAVSQRVRSLEQAVGAVLLTRTKPVRPTPEGEVLLGLALQWSLLRDEAVASLSAPHGGEGTALRRTAVPVATGADALAMVLLPAMAAVEREAPVAFELFREDDAHCLELLRQGRVICSLGSDSSPVQGHTVVPLGTMRYLPLATPGWRERHLPAGLTAQALAVAPVIAYDRKDSLQHTYLERLLGQEVNPPVTYVPAHREFEEAVVLGLGWGLVPEGRVQNRLEDGSLVRIGPGHRDVPLVWHRPRIESRVLELLEAELTRRCREVLRPAGRLGE